MGAFEYLALDEKGRDQKGVVDGDTARQVRQQLRNKGWTPLEIREVAADALKQGGVRVRRPGIGLRRLNSADLSLVTRQMATLVKSALPLEEVLHTVSQQTEKPRIKSMMMSVRSRVLEGHTLANGLADFPGAFPEYYRATVAAGEQSGHLDVVLERLADYAETSQAMRDQVKGAMIYPVILVSVAIVVVGLLLTFVVPDVIAVFEQGQQELPLLTRMLIAVSDFFRDFGLLVLIVLVGAVFGFRYWLQQEKARFRFHKWLLNVPFVSRLVRNINTARFARTFSILTASGVPVLDTLKISAEVMSNLPMRKAVWKAAERVREGSNINSALRASECFSPMTLQLIAAGEASGNLEQMLDRAAGQLEREIQGTISTSLKMMEPALLVIVGGLVLMIVLAILMPIFNMNQLLQ